MRRDAYEEIADFMLTTVTGQWSVRAAGLTRDDLVQYMRKRFPDEAQLRAVFETLKAQAQAMFPPDAPLH